MFLTSPRNTGAPRSSSHFHNAAGLATAVLGALAFAGCSGGGSSTSSGAVEGLTIANQMSVVTTNNPGSPDTVTPHAQADTSSFSASSDYNTDVSNLNVYDPSMKTLQTVNQILCMLTQTAYAKVLNGGVYKAQIDEKKCDNGSDSSSSQDGQSSNAGAAAPEIWVVNCTRASNGADEVVDFWVPQSGGNGGSDPDGTIRAHMVIHEGVSDANPFGKFELDFVGVPTGGTLADAFMSGLLRTVDVTAGHVGFEFFNAEGDITQVQLQNHHAQLTQANVDMSADQTTGIAHILRQERENFSGTDSGIQTTDYALAFNSTNLLRQKDSDAPVCLSRTAFHSSIWRYNLYDATTGARIELNSGFGFKTADDHYGFIGYWGMWVQDGVVVNNGDVITKDVYGSQQATHYTVVTAPGKLIKNTRNTLLLTAIGASDKFTFWDGGPSGGQPHQGPPTQYQVEYQPTNPTQPGWQRVATWNDQSHTWDPLDTPTFIDTSLYHFLGMWSDSLGGSVSYADGDDHITYFAQTFVNGSSDLFAGGDTVDLSGYFQCLRPDITSQQADNGNVYQPPSFAVDQPYHFQISKTDLTLMDVNGASPAQVGLATGATISTGPYTWGMRSGPMVTSTASFVNANDIWNADVFYTYETGPNTWNHYTTITDMNGAAVTFDAPIQFTYTHHTGDDLNGDSTFDGHNYFLNYGGPGNFGGIPFEGVDLDGDGSPDRWYPLFSIHDATLCGPTGTEYVIRGLDGEQTLAVVALGQCASLDITSVSTLTLPTAADFTAPTTGDAPAVSGPPLVIEGVVQGSGN